MADIRKAFDMPAPTRPEPLVTFAPELPELTLEHRRTIAEVDANEWNALLGAEGSFTWEGLRFLEETFHDQPREENNWRFHYYLVRDRAGKPVLATFFTESLWKDDMIADEKTSRLVEERRKKDPYFLTSRTLSMGAPLTEGQHLYLDRRADWRQAMKILLAAIAKEQGETGAGTLALRDLPADDAEMEAFLLDQGYAKFAMPESLVLDLDWKDEADFLAKLPHRYRRHQLRQVMPHADAYDVEVLDRDSRQPSPEELRHFYRLYSNVKGRSLLLNTFDLPEDIYAHMLASPDWELLVMRLKPELGGETVSVVACFTGGPHYVPLVIGMDYAHLERHGVYRASLWTAIRRAKALGYRRVLFGMGAALEKRRFGAVEEQRAIYMQASEHFNMELLHQIMTDAGQGR